jgi:hypothetical protein
MAFLASAGWSTTSLCRVVGFRDGVLGSWWRWVRRPVLAGDPAVRRARGLPAGRRHAGDDHVGQRVLHHHPRAEADGGVRCSAARRPNPLPGKRGKQRSVHNTYFTLPVVFAMLSIHYAPAHAHQHEWIVLAVFMTAGALIRQFFVLWHSGGSGVVAAAGRVVWCSSCTFAWLAPKARRHPLVRGDRANRSTSCRRTTAFVAGGAGAALRAVPQRQPTLMPSAPARRLPRYRGRHRGARREAVPADRGALKIMPPGNLTQMTDGARRDRTLVRTAWRKASLRPPCGRGLRRAAHHDGSGPGLA